MPKAYLISTYQEIHNPDALAAYAKLALPALTAAGGTFLQAALDAYDSPAYQAAMHELGDNAVVRDIRIIEGV